MKNPRYFFSSLINRIKRKRGLPKPKKQRIENVYVKNSIKSLSLKITAIVGVVSILVYLFIPYISAVTTFDLTPVEGVEREGVENWFGNNRMTVLFVGLDRTDPDHPFVDNLMLFVIDPHSNNIGIFNINPDLSVFVPKMKKSINLRSAYASSTEEEGLENIITAAEALLALRLDRYVLVDMEGFAEMISNILPPKISISADLIDFDTQDQEGELISWEKGEHSISAENALSFLSGDSNGSDEQLSRQLAYTAAVIEDLSSIRYLKKIPRILESIANNASTNFTEIEVMILATKLRSVRSDQIKKAFTRAVSWEPYKSFGIYEEFYPIVESIDDDLSVILMNTEILKEQARIEVLNGSGVRGLASSRARWITNSGGRVIYFGNSPESEDITKVYVNKGDFEKYEKTLTEIEKIFNGKIEYSDEEYKYKHLGDIVIIIGEEYE